MEDIANYDHISNITEVRDLMNMELNRAAVSFVRIGYLLKTVRDDPDMLKDTAYSSVNEFAMAEFGLDKSAVSRFMRINDRFSLGGYSEQLKENYEGFGSAKLSLMLTLPDEINEELSPEYTKSEINAIKSEYEAEQKISDLEVMMEEKPEGPDDFLAQIVKELNDEHPESAQYLNTTLKLAKHMNIEAAEQDIQEAYIPEGTAAYSVRIPGRGRYMVTMKEQEITILSLRDATDKSSMTWTQFKDLLMADMQVRDFPEEEKKPEKKKSEKVKPAKPKENRYVEEVRKYHEQEEVAPVQQIVEQCEDNAAHDKTDEEKDTTPKEAVEDPEDTAAAGDTVEELTAGEEAEEAQTAAGVEKVTPAAEDVLTSSQKDMLEWLDLIRRKVVPEDGSRPDWVSILDELKTMERYVKQLTY